MSITNPGRARIAFILFATKLISRSRYRRFVEGIELDGDESVLDFGAGWGENTRYLAQRLNKGGRVTALDVSPEWQEVARKRLRGYGNIDFVTADVRSANLPDGSFDVIVISYVLHDIPRPQRAPIARELAKKLTPNGFIIIREPTKPHHGMPVEDIRSLMTANKLKESSPEAGRGEFSAMYRNEGP